MFKDNPKLLANAIDYLQLDRPNAPRHLKFVVDQKMTS